MRIHHLEEFNTVVLATNKRVSLPTFTAKHREPLVCELLVNSSALESADKSPVTADDTPNDGNVADTTLHEGTMTRYSDLQIVFLDTATDPAGGPVKQRVMTDIFKSSSTWTEKQEK
jgi:hypothetical protein